MKFVGVRDFRNQSSKIWNELKQEKEFVITCNGKPLAILSSVSEDNLEEIIKAFRSARALCAVTEIQKKSQENKKNKITLQEINEEIRKTRKKRVQ